MRIYEITLLRTNVRFIYAINNTSQNSKTQSPFNTHLFLLLVEVIDDDTNEEVESEEGAEDDEDDEVQVHVQVHLIVGLFLQLRDGKQ